MHSLSYPCNNRSAEPLSRSAEPPPTMRSTLPLSDWRGSLAIFRDWRRPRQFGCFDEIGWEEVCALLAPDDPTIVSDKACGQSFLPCLLQEAPLVGSTLAAAQKAGEPTIGRMRSQHHVTKANMLVIDIDGLAEADFMASLAKLEKDGITYLAYTTHSFGRADKPGMRARLIVPVDGDLDIEGYRLAWCSFDLHYFNGQLGKADPSAARLYQSQGMRCCHPDRVDQARSWVHSDGVASSVALREIGALSSEAHHVPRDGAAALSAASLADEEATLVRLETLLNGLDPDCHYDNWLRVLAVIFNETSGSEEGFALANRWSSAGKKYKGEGETRRKWSSFRLDHPNPARLGSLIQMRRDADGEGA